MTADAVALATPLYYFGMTAQFHAICRYLHWQEGGMVLAFGSNTGKYVENSEYQAMARDLGASL